jgi:hypothetical protein
MVADVLQEKCQHLQQHVHQTQFSSYAGALNKIVCTRIQGGEGDNSCTYL